MSITITVCFDQDDDELQAWGIAQSILHCLPAGLTVPTPPRVVVARA